MKYWHLSYQWVSVLISRLLSHGRASVGSIDLLVAVRADPERFAAPLRSALELIAELSAERRALVSENVRCVVVTGAGVETPGAPYGSYYVRDNSQIWQSRTSLAVRLVWVAAFIASVRRLGPSRTNFRRANLEADEVWKEMRAELNLLGVEDEPGWRN